MFLSSFDLVRHSVMNSNTKKFNCDTKKIRIFKPILFNFLKKTHKANLFILNSHLNCDLEHYHRAGSLPGINLSLSNKFHFSNRPIQQSTASNKIRLGKTSTKSK